MSDWKDVTKEVSFGINDDESLPIQWCDCGKIWQSWQFWIGIEPNHPTVCPACGKEYYWEMQIRVFSREPEKSIKE
jgi:hypothetical protein